VNTPTAIITTILSLAVHAASFPHEVSVGDGRVHGPHQELFLSLLKEHALS
jgi:hypothetical protein